MRCDDAGHHPPTPDERLHFLADVATFFQALLDTSPEGLRTPLGREMVFRGFAERVSQTTDEYRPLVAMIDSPQTRAMDRLYGRLTAWCRRNGAASLDTYTAESVIAIGRRTVGPSPLPTLLET